LHPLLKATNGCFIFGTSFYGMAPSMLTKPPHLDRTKLQCHDIATANREWKREYTNASDQFHFAYRSHSDTENAGYFLVGKTTIRATLKSGEVIGEWSDLATFLKNELAASEKHECSEIPEEWWH